MNTLRRISRTLRLAALAVVGLACAYYSQPVINVQAWPVDDFVEYWAAARLLLTGGNPYSPQQLSALQKVVGWSETAPVVMWNPPWALVAVLPFGLMDYFQARHWWLCLQLGTLLTCTFTLTRTYEIRPQDSVWLWMLSLAYFPFLFVLRTGQISPLLLAGATGFLVFARHQRFGPAALMAALTSFKPHLLYLFWIALALWVLDRRQWKVFGGIGAAIVLAVAIPMAFNARLVLQYAELVSTHPPMDWATPTLGGLLRVMLGTEHSWLQFLPSLAGVFWCFWHYRRNRAQWVWTRQMPLLLLVSVATASYGSWTYDQVVLLPALIAAFKAVVERQTMTFSMGPLMLFFAANLTAYSLNWHGVNEIWFFWMAPVWLALYLWIISRDPRRGIKHTRLSR